MLKRLRFKQTETFEQRLSREAAKLRKEAQGTPAGIKRERLIQRERECVAEFAWACRRRNDRRPAGQKIVLTVFRQQRRKIMSQQIHHGLPEQDSYHVGATTEQSNPGGLGQPRGPGGQQLPGHETSQTGGGQYTRDQMTLGDVTDPSDGHHQPPGQEALPGEISRIDQPKPGDGQDDVADRDDMWDCVGT